MTERADVDDASAGPQERARTPADSLPKPLRYLDQIQQRYAVLAIPIAVYKKFSDDEAGKLAALISYYAFLSVFPLLIVFATVLSHALVDHPELAEELVQTAAGSFLSIGSTGSVEPLNVSGLALAAALAIALWAGLAVAHSMQDAMNTVYEVPKTERASFVARNLRSLSLLVLVGVGLPLTTVLQGFASAIVTGVLATVVIYVLVLVCNTALIAAAFRQSTVAQTSWRGVAAGAGIAAIAWVIMQALAASLLTGKVEGAQASYGPFAMVIGLLFWFFLLAQITIYCAELNVVLSFQLWPRGLASVISAKADTEADIRAYTHYPKREQQATNVQVSVDVVEERDVGERNATG